MEKTYKPKPRRAKIVMVKEWSGGQKTLKFEVKP